jgi:hypothetical protein
VHPARDWSQSDAGDVNLAGLASINDLFKVKIG